jgi:hypothetical protein
LGAVPLFRRKRADTRETGPEWAQPMSADEAAAFLEAIDRELERRGQTHELGEGLVRVERDGEWTDFGLTNLAQFCHQIDRNEWQSAIATHFDNLFAAAAAEAELEQAGREFERIRSMLKVRIYPNESLGGLKPGPPTSWELAPGLIAAFVYDLPTTVRTANVEHVQAWGKSHEEILSVAVENVREDTVQSERLGEGESAPIACFADHFFAASHALLLGDRIPPGANGNAVFAIPHRHALLYAPVVDLGVVQSINDLIVTAVSMFNQGPGSISPGLYWWREGSVTLLPSSFDGKKVDFAPPDEFVELLNGLAAP